MDMKKNVRQIGMMTLLMTSLGCAGGMVMPNQDNLEVKLRRFEVIQASFDNLETEVVVEVLNTSTAAFQAANGVIEVVAEGRAVVDDEGTHLDEADLDAQFSGSKFQGDLASATAIPPQEKTLLRFPVTLKLPDDPKALEHVIGWERVLLSVKGDVKISGKTFTFGGERELGLPVFPEITLLNPQVATVDGGKSGVAFFQVLVKNQNNFEMTVDNFDWGLTLVGKELRALGQGGPEQVPPNSDLQLDDEVPLTRENLGPNVRSILKRHHLEYSVKGFWNIKGVQREFNFDGAIEFAR